MNKRGWSPAIVVLVLLTLLVTSTTMTIFLIDLTKIKTSIGDAKFLFGVYEEEIKLGGYFSDLSKDAFLTSYNEVIANLNKDFNTLNVEREFASSFEKNFALVVSNSDFLKDDKFKEFLLSGETKVSVLDVAESSIYSFLIESNFVKGDKEINIAYRMNKNYLFDFNKIGVESFRNIRKAFDECSGSDELKVCLETELNNFEVYVNLENGKRKVEFKGKKSFVIDGKIITPQFNVLFDN